METYLFSESFIMVRGIRISVYRKQYYSIYSFFSACGANASSKIRFHQPKTRISLKNTFPLDRKKTGRGLQNMEKKMATNRKIVIFLLIPVMVSTNSEIALNKKYCFTRQKMSSFFETCFPLIPIMVSTSQK